MEGVCKAHMAILGFWFFYTFKSTILLHLGFENFFYENYTYLIFADSLILFSVQLKLYFTQRKKEYFASSIMGCIIMTSLNQIFLHHHFYFLQLYLYLLSLCVYHFMEYFFVLAYHSHTLSFESFLIDQSKEYIFATIFSIVEFFIENLFFHEWKLNPFFMTIGGIMMLTGHLFRIGALFTAKGNFTHKIANIKKPKHVLVTNGIYQFSRHPSYFGFFIWSVGSQIMCVNPISAYGFARTLWKFFNNRIKYEEETLIRFFGKEYIEYKNRVGILIPCKLNDIL